MLFLHIRLFFVKRGEVSEKKMLTSDNQAQNAREADFYPTQKG